MFLLQYALNSDCTITGKVGGMQVDMTLSSPNKCTDIPEELQMDLKQLQEGAGAFGITAIVEELVETVNEELSSLNLSISADEILSYFQGIEISGQEPGIYPSALMCAAFEKKSCTKGSAKRITLKSIGMTIPNYPSASQSYPVNMEIPVDLYYEADPSPFAGSNQQVAMATSSIVLAVVVVVLIIVLVVVCCKSKNNSKNNKQENSQNNTREERVVPQQQLPYGQYQPMYNQQQPQQYYNQPQTSQPSNTMYNQGAQ